MNETIQRYDTSKKKSRILIVDEHSIIHRALAELIGQDPGLEFCAKAENAKQLWEIIDKQQVDLAIVDISLKGMNGLQIVEEIKLKLPLSAHIHHESVELQLSHQI
jgi:DNA-binding NarL/FixJ family response regulator